MRQSWNVGTNNYVADYFYDETGAPLGFAYSINGGDYQYYFYETNLQGDVTRIFDVNGTGIASFTYDAWGYIRSSSVNSALDREVFLKASLFRYRGYIYDSETGLYYLQSRYYDPQTGRFINPDGIINANGGVLGNNLYAYCNNNPVNYSDTTGNSITAIGIVTAVAIGAVAILTIATLIWLCTDEGQASVQRASSNIAYAMDDFFSNIEEQIRKLNDDHPGEYVVYGLRDGEGNIKYVGRTKNLNRRLAAHKNSQKTRDLELSFVTKPLTWSEARGMEQFGILLYNTKELGVNSINGISPKNPNKKAYMSAARNYLYNQVSNELYNLIERITGG